MIYASLTAYGEDGPERDREGFDLVAYWARTGLMDLVRTGDVEPAQSLPGMGDHPSAVALYAASSRRCFVANGPASAARCTPRCWQTGSGLQAVSRKRRLVDADFSGWRSPTRIGADAPGVSGRGRSLAAVHDGPNSRRNRSASAKPRPGDMLIARSRFATPEARLENGVELVGRMRDANQRVNRAAVASRSFREAKVPGALMGTLDDLVADPQLPSIE